jgi:hypothetical protein
MASVVGCYSESAGQAFIATPTNNGKNGYIVGIKRGDAPVAIDDDEKSTNMSWEQCTGFMDEMVRVRKWKPMTESQLAQCCLVVEEVDPKPSHLKTT